MDAAFIQAFLDRLGAPSDEDRRGGTNGNMRAEMFRLLLDASKRSEELDELDTAESTSARVASAERHAATLREALRKSTDLIRYIGRTFGACELCWGTRIDCPRCGGRGGPGSGVVDTEEAMGWITPTLDRIGLRSVQIAPEREHRRPAAASAREEI